MMLFLSILAMTIQGAMKCDVTLNGVQHSALQLDIECPGPGEKFGMIKWNNANGVLTVHVHNQKADTCRKMNIMRMQGQGEIFVEGHSLAKLTDDFLDFEKEPKIGGGAWVQMQVKAQPGVPNNQIEIGFTMKDTTGCLSSGALAMRNATTKRRQKF